MRWMVTALAAVLGLCAAGALSIKARAKEQVALSAETARLGVTTVSTGYPQPEPRSNELELPGSVQASTESPIYARTNGYLLHWYKDIGAAVQKGELLADLDTPEVDQELSASRGATDCCGAGTGETKALAANQDLVSEGARVEQARALASVAMSNFYPQVGVSPSFERFRLSANRPSLGGVVDGPVTRTQAALERRLRANYEHALAVLCGAPAQDFRVETGSLAKYLPAIPSGVPSDLLERRPDIAMQERLMASANAQIGVATSAYYPSLQLAASAGVESTGIGNLISLPSSLWAVGATLAQPLISGGRIRAGVDFAKAGYQDSVAQYRQTVLVAFQEVEDALAGLEVFAGGAKSQDAAVADSQLALNMALNRYTGGLVTYLDVVTAQQSLLSNQREAAQIQGGRLVASVMLVKALGGGWDAQSLAGMPLKPSLKTAIQP